MDKKSFLRKVATRLGREAGQAPAPRGARGIPDFHKKSGDGPALLEQFCRESELLGVTISQADNLSQVHVKLRETLEKWKVESLAAWAPEEFPGWDLEWLWQHPSCFSWDGRDSSAQAAGHFRSACMGAQAGITSVDFAVANTGTLVFTARRGRPRSVSLLPSMHLALVKSSQIVSRMGLAFPRSGEAPPSLVQFVSGPSRTSDIENDHTIGVHGPAMVNVIVWKDR